MEPGQQIGYWTLIKRGADRVYPRTRQRTWVCLCECGTVAVRSEDNLKRGATKSCGCKKGELCRQAASTHGMSGTRTFAIWKNMKTRCYNPNTKAYPNYGGRGIRICERWHVFEKFLDDMGECPDGYTIERIDNDGDYEPENCEWASRFKQASNRRDTVWVAIGDERVSLAEACRRTGANYSTARDRVRRGLKPELASEVA